MSYKESDWKIRGYEGGGFSHDEYMEMESWEMNDFHEGTIKRFFDWIDFNDTYFIWSTFLNESIFQLIIYEFEVFSHQNVW